MTVRVEPGSEPIPGYKLIERLGGGGFGEVWKVEAPGGLLKALKIVHGDMDTTDADGTKRAAQELKAMERVKSVRHPYLLSLERYDIVDGRLLIVMELADANLWDRFRACRAQGQPGIPRNELLRYLEESAEVLDLMNTEYQLQHLDIKPQNLFLVHNHAKVADFGLVKDLQGMMATITGGITPVYAAPETFDGKVTRFCDQYSLAIVYQELLTGQRPFAGTSLQQLIMQHLSAAPNLNPLPKSDRAAIGRSLAKKPEERFPSCSEMVRALRTATEELPRPVVLGTGPPPTEAERSAAGMAPTASAYSGGAPTPPATVVPRTELRPTPPVTPIVEAPDSDLVPAPQAPPKRTGDGVLFPALVVGLGRHGRLALQSLRQSLHDRFGSMQAVPHIRLLYLDTDPDEVQAATQGRQGPPFSASETLAARLNRPSHYLITKPVGGKFAPDYSWINHKFIYRIPRNPATTGLRSLGRLAFTDNYRSIVAKFQSDLDACTEPDALASAMQQTKLEMRSNQPRVYVVTSLTGGSGSGMFLDVAYTIRAVLRQLGYAELDIVGVLLLPVPAERQANVPSLGNAVAALTELKYYSAPGSSFAFKYGEDKASKINDPSAPFGRSVLLPLEPELDKERAGETARLVGEFLYRDLMTPLGKMADTLRPPAAGAEGQEPPKKLLLQTLSLYRFTWPRKLLVQKAARQLCSRLVERWMAKEGSSLREPIRGWLAQALAKDGLEGDQVINSLREACEKEIGHPPESIFTQLVEPFVPKSRRDPDPDADEVDQAYQQMKELVGPVTDGVKGKKPIVEVAMDSAAAALIRKWGNRLAKLALGIVEDPSLRIRGAEEAVRQLTAVMDESIEGYEGLCKELDEQAALAQSTIREIRHVLQQGGRRAAGVAGALVEALNQFPRLRYQILVLRRVITIYVAIRGKLSDEMRELTFSRQRLGELARAFEDRGESVVPRLVNVTSLLPGGCETLDDAVTAVVGELGDDDLNQFDKQIQGMIEQQFVSLFQITMSSSNVIRSLEAALLTSAESFISGKLEGASVVDMFLAQHADDEGSARQAIEQAFQAAAPVLARKAAADEPEVRVLALPQGASADRFRALVRQAVANAQLAVAQSSDDIIFYREQPDLPIDQLELLGLAGQDAYRQMTRNENFSPHSREDIADWQAVAK